MTSHRIIGVSTGAFVGLTSQYSFLIELLDGYHYEDPPEAIELSALREAELPILLQALPELDLSRYSYVSVHVPSKLEDEPEAEIKLLKQLEREELKGVPLVVHPNIIKFPENWSRFGSRLCLENMDIRTYGRTVKELKPYFDKLPNAKMCLDVGHALQVDPSGGVLSRLISSYGDRVTQIHWSVVGVKGKHKQSSYKRAKEAALYMSELDCPIILETPLDTLNNLNYQIVMVRRCLATY